MDKGGLYFIERVPYSPKANRRLEEVFFYGNTKFQNVLIARSPEIGTFLALDHDLQSSELDCHIYHESLAHAPASLLDKPRNALIIGGGEGTTALELSRYKNLNIDWVEIDGEVVQLCKKYLPYALKASKSNVKLIEGDGLAFIKNSRKAYDLILGDITEPFMSPIAGKIYGKDFAKRLYDRLTEQGIYVTLGWERRRGKWVRSKTPNYLKEVFPIVRSMHFYMPSFGMDFSMVIASKLHDPKRIASAEIRNKIKGFKKELRFYNEKKHKELFL